MKNIHGHDTPELLRRIAECIENWGVYLYIRGWNITSLPELPSTLVELDCSNTNLISLSKLPDSLQVLHCSGTQLKSLPKLPDSLTYLNCSYTPLTHLPDLPDGLIKLHCNNTQITTLPKLPDSLVSLDCSDTQIESLPTLPRSIHTLYCCNILTIVQLKEEEYMEDYILRVRKHHTNDSTIYLYSPETITKLMADMGINMYTKRKI